MRYSLLVVGLLLVSSLSWLSSTSYGHDAVIRACANVKDAKLVKSAVLPNGLIAEAYDTNGDGKMDIVTFSAPRGGAADAHEHLPIFYEIDVDGDNKPDALLLDAKGDGTCESLYLYDDYHAPGEHRSPLDQKWLAEGS